VKEELNGFFEPLVLERRKKRARCSLITRCRVYSDAVHLLEDAGLFLFDSVVQPLAEASRHLVFNSAAD
jgi:hypothetical protein